MLLAAVLLIGCGRPVPNPESPDSRSPVAGGTMTYFIDEPRSLEPRHAVDADSLAVISALFDPLVKVDPHDSTILIGAAAETFSSTATATVWTFELDQTARFSDGSPVRAQDFVYAFNRIANPQTVDTITREVAPSPIIDSLALVVGFDEVITGTATTLSGVRALDDYTLQITLTRPFADFAYLMAHPAFSPLPQETVERGTEHNGTLIPYGEMPIGNGAFKLDEPWRHDQHLKTVRSDMYRGERPYLEGVTFRMYRDVETAYREFLAGNLDYTLIAPGEIEAAVTQFGSAPDGYRANPGEQVLLGGRALTYSLVLNNEHEQLANPAVRRAISRAIDREALCADIFADTHIPATNIVSPGVAGYVERAWADTRFDANTARSALAESGYPEGAGLVPFVFIYPYGTGHRDVAEQVQRDLATVGIRVELEELEWEAYLERLAAGAFGFASVSYGADYLSAYPFLEGAFASTSPENFARYRSEATDVALAEIATMDDNEIRSRRLEALNKTIAADNPVVPLTHPGIGTIVSTRMRDFSINVLMVPDWTNVWIPRDRQQPQNTSQR